MIDRIPIQATLLAELRTAEGSPVLRRFARNTVLESGALLVSELFCGKFGTPVNGVAVGADNTPTSAPYELSGLTTTDDDDTPLVSNPAVAIPPEDFQVEVSAEETRVKVSLRTVLGPNIATHPDPNQETVEIGEAALGVLDAEGTGLQRIYNRVIFDMIPKSRKHELVLYWEVTFPFGPSV